MRSYSNRNAAWLAVALMTVTLSIPAFGQTPPKVGFINFNEALQTIAEVKARIAIVEQFVESKNQESDTQIDAINKLRDQINLGTGIDLEAVTKQLAVLETDFRRFQEDTQAEISSRRDVLFQTYAEKLQKVIEEFAREGNYQVIFPIDSEVAYMDENLILTSQIVARYDSKYPQP